MIALAVGERYARVPPRIRYAPITLVLGPRHEGVRRALNVAVAAAGVVITAPLMLLIMVLVKLTSPGPVFFTQVRVGLDRRRGAGGGNHRRSDDRGGQPFRMFKFRTMYCGAAARQVWASDGDGRITPLGRILRRYRLDELPQLFNVLAGHMNVVGPRPEQPEIFLKLSDQIDAYRGRQRVRPGITGWAQINLPYDGSVHDVRQKVAYDLQYIWRQSALEDLRIMLRTLPVMLSGQGSK